MRLVFACVVAWFVLAATAALVASSSAAGAPSTRSGSLIVTKA